MPGGRPEVARCWLRLNQMFAELPYGDARPTRPAPQWPGAMDIG
jgi:hypothetical protein